MAALVGLSAPALGQGGIFRAPSSVVLGRGANAVAVVDADIDGVEDACVGDAGGVRVITPDQAGALLAWPPLSLGGEVVGLARGRIDGDSLPDLVAVVRQSASLLFLPGVGSRALVDNPVGSGRTRFFGVPDTGIALGGSPTAMALGDFDADGELDAAVALAGALPTDPGTIVVLLGDGSGGFAADGTVHDVGPGTSQLVAADFVGDGVVDLIALEGGAGTLRWYSGNGDGSFSDDGGVDLAAVPSRIVAVEVDAAPGRELAVTSVEAGGVLILAHASEGFAEVARHPTGSGAAGVAPVDADGDGRDEILVANRRSFDVAIVTPGDTRRFIAGDEPFLIAPLSLDSSRRPGILAIGGGAASNTAYLLRARGSGFHASTALPVPGAVRTIALDADADGRVDVVSVGGDSLLAHTFSDNAPVLLGAAELAGPAGSVAGFVDESGSPSAAITIPSLRQLSVWTFAGGAWRRTGVRPLNVAAQEIVAADFNADGAADVAVAGAESAAPVVVLGPLGPSSAIHETPDFAARVRRMTALDANCDGLSDLALVDAEAGAVSLLLNEGDGRLRWSGNLGASGSAPASIVAADFDADGRDDLAVGSDFDIAGQPVRLYYGDCVSPLVEANRLPGGQTLADLVVADIDGNRLVDVISASSSGNQMRTARGSSFNPSGVLTFRAAVSDGTSRRPERLAVGDWNGDGTYDVAATNVDGNAQTVSVAWNCSADADCTPFGGGSGLRERRGDGNGDDQIGAADFVLLISELSDGDGQRVEDATRRGISSSAGVDANGDTRVDRLDLGALARRVFARR